MQATIERKATDKRDLTEAAKRRQEKTLTWDRAVEMAICGY